MGNGTKWNVNINYILQQKPQGLAHAVKVSREFLGVSPFLMYLGDNLTGVDLKQLIYEFSNDSNDATIFLKEVQAPEKFGVARLDNDKRVIGLVEKPSKPPSNLALIGLYLFSPEIHPAIDNITLSERNELEITDAIQKLIDTGKSVKSNVIDSWWIDTGKKDDIIEANRVVLESISNNQIYGTIDKSSKLYGNIMLGEGSNLKNSRITGPAVIGENSTIINSVIGPHTSIGNDCTIEDSNVECSVILDGSEIKKVHRISRSLVGYNSRVTGESRSENTFTLHIGDDSEVAY